jgi:selenocysteine lyase/cysteine desulfurase
MLGPKTRLVATVHVSNMLGSITDIADLSRAVHAVRRVRALHVALVPNNVMDFFCRLQM